MDLRQRLLKELADSMAIVEDVRRSLDALNERAARLRGRTDELVALHRRDLQTRVALAGFTGPTLMADAIAIVGRPSRRLDVRRIEVGERVTRTLGDWVGITRCVTTDEEVRRLWEGLLARETQDDGVLRGGRSTLLDVPDAVVWIEGGALHVSVGHRLPTPDSRIPDRDVIAVPRFSYATPPRKLRNFGHWLLDCVPQTSVLAGAEPGAPLMLPGPLKPFQRWSLEQLGFREDQLVPWDGSPLSCRRLLAFESDGRTGGGRPLSALVQLRDRLRGPEAPRRGSRRIYVSRRDARTRRRWVSNQPEIEALFQSRGFEVVSMAECPLDEQARLFRDAHIVAGVSGAGLTNLIFSPPGTHAIVLLSDSLIRWYAESGSRSLWARSQRGAGGQLAALGDSPRFYAHLAAAFEQTCHNFVAGDEMPMDHLSDFVDAVLADV